MVDGLTPRALTSVNVRSFMPVRPIPKSMMKGGTIDVRRWVRRCKGPSLANAAVDEGKAVPEARLHPILEHVARDQELASKDNVTRVLGTHTTTMAT